MSGIADPASQPAAALLIEVGAHEEQQPGRGEDHEVWEEEREAQRDVRQQDQPEHDQGVHRTMAAEDRERGVGAGRPGDAAGHQQEGGRLGRTHLADEQVDPEAIQGRAEVVKPGAELGRARVHARDERDDEGCPDAGTHEMDEAGRQLRLGAHEAPRATGQEHERQEPCAAVAGDGRPHPARAVDRDAQRQEHDHEQPDGGPALGR